MSHLVSRVVVVTPHRSWIDRVVDAWDEVRRSMTVAWRGELRPRSAERFEDVRIPDTVWPRLAREIRAGAHGDAWLTGEQDGRVRAVLGAELVTRVSVRPHGDALSAHLYPTLPPWLESERHARCITMSIESSAAAASALAGVTNEIVRISDACWAQLSVEPGPAGPFTPASRSAREWEPYVRERAPDAGWQVFLGAGHVAALGGMAAARQRLAAFAPTPVELNGGATALALEAAPSPVGADDARVIALREALAPILLASPIAPASAHVLAPGQIGAEPVPDLEDVALHRLADNTVILEAASAHRRDDVAAGQRSADAVQRIYAYLATLGLPRRIDGGRRAEGEVLALPRFLGDRVYWRYAPSMPVRDTGEPLGELVPVTVLLDGRRRSALAGALGAVVGEHAPSARCEITDDRLRFELPVVDARGDRFLAFLLALDRAAAATRSAIGIGVVLGRIVPPDEMLDRVGRGEWPGLGPLPA